MSTTPAQIDLWLSSPSEHQRLEFKEAKTQLDNRKLYRYCVALANEGGGYLLLGVTDKLPRAVVGTSAFNNPVDMAAKIFQAVGFRVDIEEVQHPNGRVLVFHIPARPRGTAYHLDGAYLMRSGEELVPMSEDQLRRIFAEGDPDWLEEPSLQGLDAQRVIDLLDTQTFFELLKLPYPTNRAGVIDRLIQERLVDKQGDNYAIRRLGALLLGKVKLLPEITIRELVANALIHQDFRISGASVMVEIYSNRVEISNPGDPVVPVERFIDGYQSRNERLADLMRRMGICEEKSSGIDRVVQAAEVYQLPAPDFRAAYHRTVVILSGPKPFESMDRDERIRACYQHCALKWVMSERMTNQSLRERFHLPESKSAIVSQIIAASIEAGLIKPDEKVGASKKFARYLPFWA